jgi:hypothetical protein
MKLEVRGTKWEREKGKGKRDSSLKGELYGAQRSNKG